MATLNHFQRYSQSENTATNNVLLMFSLIYETNPKYYDEFIGGLIEDANAYSIMPDFRQQVGNAGNGIIDGHIVMKRSSIIIETKLDGLEFADKLIKYTDSFQSDDAKLLFHLSKQRFSSAQIKVIEKKIEKKHPQSNIRFHSLTYNDLVDQLFALHQTYIYDAQLRRIYEHFEEYCKESNLLERNNILRAMACGQSFGLNIKHRFYFDLASRGYSNFNYLGIYYWKAVRYIGKVENVIVAEYDYREQRLIITDQEREVTEEQHQRLITAILEADALGWGISQNHKFFLLKDFHETNFVKTSPGGIFRARFFNLEEYLGKGMTKDVGEIAEELRSLTWI